MGHFLLQIFGRWSGLYPHCQLCVNARQTSQESAASWQVEQYIMVTNNHSNINHPSNRRKKYLVLIHKHEFVFRWNPRPILPQNVFEHSPGAVHPAETLVFMALVSPKLLSPAWAPGSTAMSYSSHPALFLLAEGTALLLQKLAFLKGEHLTS